MGITVSKASAYKSLPMEPSDNFSSININVQHYNNGMPMVNENAVHRQHFRRVLNKAPRGRIPSGGNAK